MSDAISFRPLPYPKTRDGAPRKTGVEVEFAGLDTDQTCQIIEARLGGTREGSDPFCSQVTGTVIGDLTVELDTPARKASDNDLMRIGLDAAAVVVPLEIITEPLDEDGLTTFNGLLPDLREAGATGSRSGILLGFGVHLNPDVVAIDDAHTMNTIRAYALIEEQLRQLEKLDVTRRILPFVSPWSDGFVTDLLNPEIKTLKDLIPVAARHISSRNHGLDLLPLLKFAHPDSFDSHFPDTKTGARPAFHFRLPDCRIDEPNWNLLQPWALWSLVETVAAHPDALAELIAAWRNRDTRLFSSNTWPDTTASVLMGHNLETAA